VLMTRVATAMLALTATAMAKKTTSNATPNKLGVLPGYDDAKAINFDHYAGRIELHNKQKMFYWLVEAEANAATAPLVLWLNGGPGCSSISGMFTENGPFIVQSDLSVKRNPYAWNRYANVIYLDSPSGVGFSSPVLKANEYNDATTTERAVEFLELFLNQFPRYKNRPFYITGESYAGMYIPWIVDRLITKPLPGLNLAGMAIGNAFTDQDIDNESYIDYYYTHGLISMEAYNSIKSHCVGELARCMYDIPVNCSASCSSIINHSVKSIAQNTMDPYYIYGDICLMSGAQSLALPHMKHKKKAKKALSLSAESRNKPMPCVDTFTNAYLSSREVQAYLNLDESITFAPCSDIVGDLYVSSTSVLPKYHNILNAGLNVMIYSGDADAVVDFIGTQRWIGTLNLPIEDEWHAWYGPDHQLAGYTQGYTNLTFTTIKGAGHMVPAIRPLHGLYMIECYLFGKDKCNTWGYPFDSFEVLTGDIQSSALQTNLFGKLHLPTHYTLFSILVILSIIVIAIIKRHKRTNQRYQVVV